MTGHLLDPSGLWVPSTYDDGFYLAKKSGRRFTDWRKLAAGSNVTLLESGDELQISSSAGGGTPAFHGCAASRSSAQSITTTPTGIQFNDADEWDTDSIHDPATNNTRFTIPAGLGGVWLFMASLTWASASNSRGFNWAKNGTQLGVTYKPEQEATASSTGLVHNGATELLLAAGDYIEVFGVVTITVNCTSARLTSRFIGVP